MEAHIEGREKTQTKQKQTQEAARNNVAQNFWCEPNEELSTLSRSRRLLSPFAPSDECVIYLFAG